jgi:hypothetical protein
VRVFSLFFTGFQHWAMQTWRTGFMKPFFRLQKLPYSYLRST